MSDIAIRVDGVSKLYRLGTPERYRTLRDSVTDAIKAPFRRLRKAETVSKEAETLWALKDVSFEVKHGEVVGIIGRNGAGKSTLLKILSRITEPTRGQAEIRGRVGSLLEVGTGFHPELTGRENIFLNGAILGMKKAEILRKFDEIVSFAEVEKFVDTPVKHYSSGMYVRLAFAVAAHMETENLIVDEVLAVGDTEFQKKCLGKMESSARDEGRTVLFVSHNIAAVEGLCSSALLLSNGKVIAHGKTKSIVHEYLRNMKRGSVTPLEGRRDREGSGVVKFTSISQADGLGRHATVFQCGGDAMLVLEFENSSDRDIRLGVSLGIDNELGQRVVLLGTELLGKSMERVSPGSGMARVLIPKLCLLPGRYHFSIFATVNGTLADWVRNAGTFDVEGGDYFGTGQLPPNGKGVFVMNHSFQYEKLVAEMTTAESQLNQVVPYR
jgi:lipopolysaccharide transport system ATP-binding protein